MGIADDPGNAGERGEFFGGTLGVTAGDDDLDGGVGGVKFSDGVAGLGIGGGGHRTRVDDNDVSGGGISHGTESALAQLALDGRAVRLRGAATELFDEEGRHLEAPH